MKQLVWNVFLEDSNVEAIDNDMQVVYWIEETSIIENTLYVSNDLFDLQHKEVLGKGSKQSLIDIAQSHYDNQLKLNLV